MLHADQELGHSVVAPRSEVHDTDIQALFAEARRRRRRRRLLGAALSLMLTGAVVAGAVAGGGGHDAATRGGDRRRPAVTTKSQASRLALPAVRLAWDGGLLMVGDPATGALSTGPEVDASPTAPLVFAAGQLYWADANRNVAPIRAYDLAMGKIRYLPRGEAVFTSADGRRLFIARSSRELLELPADGSGRPIVLRAPAGWFMSEIGAGWPPTVAAGGIIVTASNGHGYTPPTARVGLWNPATGRVRILGVGISIFGVYTSPGARYSLVAWVAPSRGIQQDYSLRITNTSTGATVVASSPLHHGFVAGGSPAFSPGGKQMAVFVRTARLGSGGMSRLAIVDTSTGAVRLVPGTALYTTEDAFWSIWLPGGQRVLAGALGSAYLVDAQTLAVRPFTYFGTGTGGFSAVVLPVRGQP